MIRLPKRFVLDAAARRHLVEVAAGRATADRVVRGASVLNVFTGEVLRGDVGIASGRIAWVGGESRPAIETLDVDGGVLVPGLIEPHCHPDLLYTPTALGAAIVRHGTTTVCADTVFLSLALDDDPLVELLEAVAQGPVKFLWNLRNSLDGEAPGEITRLGAERMIGLLDRLPGVVASGEMTGWPAMLRGDPRLCQFIEAVVAAGLRVDGHAAGVSAPRLAQLAAAGVTADHEAITGDELLERLRLGVWAMLRHSSLRPDGATLALAIPPGPLRSRVMLTTDGPVALDLVRGHLDEVVRIVMSAGIDTVDAVRMATLHPATYLGLDAHIGSVAPGRCADLVLVDDLTSFRPQLVLTDGNPVGSVESAIGNATAADYASLPRCVLRRAPLDAEALERVCRAGPPMALQGVITRATDWSPPLELPSDASFLALVDRHGAWVTGTAIRGLGVAALASSFSGSGDVLLMGRDPHDMLGAYDRLLELGGGIVTAGGEVPLPILGYLHDGSMDELAASLQRVEDHLSLDASLPPIEYLLLFLSVGILPDLRVTPRGVVEVKSGKVLTEPVRLASGVAGGTVAAHG